MTSPDQNLIILIGVVPIIASLITCFFGIKVEKYYVSKYAVSYNAANMLVSVFPAIILNAQIYYLLTAWSIFGLLLTLKNKKYTKNDLVKFGFGSKTLGSIGLFIGIISFPFTQTPYLDFIKHLLSISQSSVGIPDIEIYLTGFVLILAIVHILGRLAKSNRIPILRSSSH